jgi:drug/metabolite transporter (DMT)-like permease
MGLAAPLRDIARSCPRLYPGPMKTQSNLRGIGCMVLATATFVTNDCLMKLAVADLPPFEVVILRGLSATAWCLAMLFVMGLARDIPKALNPWVLARALCEGVALLCFMVLLARIPIGDLTAIMQITPLLVVGGGALLFGDRMGVWRIALVLLGFAGAVMVAQPGSATGSLAAPLGFLAAALAAARDILGRRVPRDVPGLVAAFAIVVMVLLLGVMAHLLFETTVRPSSLNVVCLIGAGLFVVFGQLFIFLAFRFGAASAVAPFSYLAAVFAVLFGGVVFGEFPNPWSLAGMALIVGSGLGIIFAGERERRGAAVANGNATPRTAP